MPSITRRRTADPGRRASVEAEILAATRRLLTDGASFTELGVQRIADEARVARSTFYSHFRDKTDLLTRLAVTMRDASFAITQGWQPGDGVEELTVVFERVLGVYREHAAVLNAVAEVSAYDTTMRDFWHEEGLNRFAERTAVLLREEQRAGRTPGEIDVVDASRVIVIGGERAITDHIAAKGSEHDAAFARELALIWWYGVYRRPALRPVSD